MKYRVIHVRFPKPNETTVILILTKFHQTLGRHLWVDVFLYLDLNLQQICGNVLKWKTKHILTFSNWTEMEPERIAIVEISHGVSHFKLIHFQFFSSIEKQWIIVQFSFINMSAICYTSVIWQLKQQWVPNMSNIGWNLAIVVIFSEELLVWFVNHLRCCTQTSSLK